MSSEQSLQNRYNEVKKYYDQAKRNGETGQAAFLKAVDLNPSIPWWDPSRTPLFSDNDKESVYMLYGIYRADHSSWWIIFVIVFAIIAIYFSNIFKPITKNNVTPP